MNIEQAIKAIKSFKKVRRKCWDKNAYYDLKDILSNGAWTIMYDDLVADDWELVA